MRRLAVRALLPALMGALFGAPAALAVPIGLTDATWDATGPEAQINLTGSVDVDSGVFTLNLSGNSFSATGQVATTSNGSGLLFVNPSQTVTVSGGSATVGGVCIDGGEVNCRFTLSGDSRGTLAFVGSLQQPMPEPSSALLFALGGLLVGGAVRRKALSSL